MAAASFFKDQLSTLRSKLSQEDACTLLQGMERIKASVDTGLKAQQANSDKKGAFEDIADNLETCIETVQNTIENKEPEDNEEPEIGLGKMNDKLSDEQSETILKAVNKAIESKSWEKSNFLRLLLKNLVKLRDDFAKKMGIGPQAQTKAEVRSSAQIADTDKQEVFIALYSSSGSNLQSWEKILSNLPRQMISRSVYASEEDLKSFLKTKENKQNEAYIAVYVKKADILNVSPDKAAVNKLGTTLLTLKDRSLQLENISRFVHVSGSYKYDNARLVKN